MIFFCLKKYHDAMPVFNELPKRQWISAKIVKRAFNLMKNRFRLRGFAYKKKLINSYGIIYLH